jgi:pilus assembly protein CpaE
MTQNAAPRRVSGKWKHLIICPDRTLFQSLTSVLSETTPGSPFIDLKNYPNRRALAEVIANQSPNLCFLDVGSNRESALSLLADLESINSGLLVVAIHTTNDPNLILRSLRQGAREFLFQPFALDQVSQALERMERLRRESSTQAAHLGRVYCVMPGKGASGATTIACTLAFLLHRRASDSKTLLADLDPTTGTLSFLLKLKAGFSFVEALGHPGQIDEDIWKSLVTTVHGVDVILSPETPVEGMIDRQDPQSIVEFSREKYDNVVIDTRGPYGEWGLSLAQSCDELILVTTNELPNLHATQKALAHLDRNGVEYSKIRLVVNRFDSEAGLGREAIETALNVEVFAIVPNSYEAVQRSLIEGKPLAPSSNVGKAIAGLIDRLTGKQSKAERPSLLSGIFSIFENS